MHLSFYVFESLSCYSRLKTFQTYIDMHMFSVILGKSEGIESIPESSDSVTWIRLVTVTAASTTAAGKLASCGGERVSQRCHCKVFCQNSSKVLIET